MYGAFLLTRIIRFNMAAPEMETPPPRLVESWVTALAEPTTEEFGFVVYRLAYGDEAEWNSFLARFEGGTNSCWEGLVGAEKIRHKSRLHLIDGREQGIAEGDVDAARM